ncbi:MAG: glycogen-binding domain-containing protein [Gemmatimonadota bacterium]
MASASIRIALTMSLLAVAAGPIAAQGGGSSVSAGVGVAHALPPTGIDAEAASYLTGGLDGRLALGERGEAWTRLYGGLGLQERASNWASLGLGAGWRGPLGESLGWSLRGRWNGHVVGEPGVYRAWTGEIEPGVDLWVGDGSVSLRGLVGAGRAEVGSSVPFPPASGAPGAVVDDLWYAGGGTTGRLLLEAVTLRLGVEAYAAATGDYLAATTGVAGRLGDVSWDVGAELWETPNGVEPAGRLGVRIPLAGGWSSSVDAGRSSPDPRLGTRPAVRAWAGTSRRFEMAADRRDRPLYEIVRRERWPRIRFTLPAPGADRVTLAGDFTSWEPAAMERRDGVWVLERRVPPGTYHFGFMVDGEWFVPDDAPGRIRDDWGRHNATLVVPQP